MAKEIDLSQYDVTVASGIWLNSRIFGVGTYKAPVVKELVEFAKTQIEERRPMAYFSLNGDKINPYLLMEDLDVPDEDESSSEDDKKEIDVESMFKSAEEFGSLNDKKQCEYINSIKETPSELNENEADEYDKVLYSNLTAYKKVGKKKALVEIESVLALYE